MENCVKVFLRTNRLKQVDLARLLGISEPFISQVANGTANLSFDNMEKLFDLANEHGWDVSMLPSPTGEGTATYKDTRNANTSQQIDKMLDTLNEALKQNSRLIGIIEKMQEGK